MLFAQDGPQSSASVCLYMGLSFLSVGINHTSANQCSMNTLHQINKFNLILGLICILWYYGVLHKLSIGIRFPSLFRYKYISIKSFRLRIVSGTLSAHNQLKLIHGEASLLLVLVSSVLVLSCFICTSSQTGKSSQGWVIPPPRNFIEISHEKSNSENPWVCKLKKMITRLYCKRCSK